MGFQIKSELAPLLARGGSGPMHPLETLECFPGIALATFSSHELARRAIKVLRQSERLNARPVVDEVSSREEMQATSQGQTAAATAGKKRVGKRRAGAGRTASAPAAAEGGSGAGAGVGCDVGDGFQVRYDSLSLFDSTQHEFTRLITLRKANNTAGER